MDFTFRYHMISNINIIVLSFFCMICNGVKIDSEGAFSLNLFSQDISSILGTFYKTRANTSHTVILQGWTLKNGASPILPSSLSRDS